jgi:integrase
MMLSHHTVDDLLRLYTNEYLTNKAPRTQYQYQRLFRLFAEDLGGFTLEELTPLLLRSWTKRLRQRLKPGTVRQYLDVLSAVLTVAVEDLEWIAVHPMRKLPKPPPSPGRIRILSDEERPRLLAACQASRNRWLYALVSLALMTGCRRGELFSFRWQDADLERGFFRLAETKTRVRHPVPIPSAGVAILRARQEGQPPGAWIFTGTRPTTDFPGEHAWRSALQRAEVHDFHFHDLRHSFASYMAMSGATLAEIAEVLGHKSLSMTRRYAHFTASHTRGLVEKMAQQFLQPPPGS